MPATESECPPTMSAGIPFKRVVLSDPSQLPIDYSSTPGGTLYSTTPGGTRIVYDRSTLLLYRNSPLSKTPPNSVPEYLMKGAPLRTVTKENGHVGRISKVSTIEESQEQFEIDI